MWHRALALGTTTFFVGAPLWFFIFWTWFDYWSRRRTLTYLCFAAAFSILGLVAVVARDGILAGRFHPPVALQILGWVLIAVVTAFGAVADRQIGFRVRSFMPFFDRHGHIDLVTTGAYGVVRHPIYAAGIGFGAGTFLVTGYPAVLMSLVLFTVGATWFTRQEEERLTALLDDPSEYARYRQRVPALVPIRAGAWRSRRAGSGSSPRRSG